MEQRMSSIEEDDSLTDKEEMENIEQEETEKEEETSPSSPSFEASEDKDRAPPHKEKRKTVRERKQLQPSMEPRGSIPKAPNDTFTAWERRSSLKDKTKENPQVHRPRFSRLLSGNEEHLVAQKKTVLTMEPLTEEQEDLSPRPSLLKQHDAQDNVVPVNFSVPKSHQPEQITSVETVESELTTLEDHFPSTSRKDEDLTGLPTKPYPEPKKEDTGQAPHHRGATFQGIHWKLPEKSDSASTLSAQAGQFTAIWSMGQRISHWRSAHQRGYHLDQLTQDKSQKQAIMKHERDSKEAVPLPLQELIEGEVLNILKETQKSYQKNLGVNHQLTVQLEEQVEKLYIRLKGRGVVD